MAPRRPVTQIPPVTGEGDYSPMTGSYLCSGVCIFAPPDRTKAVGDRGALVIGASMQAVKANGVGPDAPGSTPENHPQGAAYRSTASGEAVGGRRSQPAASPQEAVEVFTRQGSVGVVCFCAVCVWAVDED